MGIFRDITKTLKQAAPVIGGTIGFALGGPYGAAIGSGIASLASGRSAEQSLMNAALGYGAGTMAKGAGFAKGTGTGMEKLLPSKDGAAAFGFGSPSNTMYANDAGSAIKKANTGMFDKALNFAKENKALTAAGLGSLALLGAGEEEQAWRRGRAAPARRRRGGRRAWRRRRRERRRRQRRRRHRHRRRRRRRRRR